MQINPVVANSYSQINLLQNNKSLSEQANISEPSFGLHNPKSALDRALKLKETYALAGIKYVMPSEVWSASKIEKLVDKVDLNIKDAIKNKNLTEEFIQKEINKILLPKDRNKIVIKDLSELPKYGDFGDDFDEEDFGGMQMKVSKTVNGIFLPLKQVLSRRADDFDKINFRTSLAHELTHDLFARYQNCEHSLDYHYNRLSDDVFYEKSAFNAFESKFYDYFDGEDSYDKIKTVDKEGLFKFMKVHSEKGLFKKFEDALHQVQKEYIQDGLDPAAHNSRQFYLQCQGRARDEKYAYKTNKIIQELDEPYNMPTKNDYSTLLYEEMEKFFAQKSKDAETLPEYDPILKNILKKIKK